MTDSTTDLIERLDKLSNHGQTQEDYKTIQEAITALSPALPDATAVNTLGELQQEIERLQADNADKSQLLARFKGRIDEYEQALEYISNAPVDDGDEMKIEAYEVLERIRGMK